nr:n(6)-hydroxylysine o-acetyltransferase [Quercus suber]
MAPSIVHLPNGQTLTVTPVFGGIGFRLNELNTHNNVFPPGWNLILHCEDDEDDHPAASVAAHTQLDPNHDATPNLQQKKPHAHRFRTPSLRNDHLYISSISNPSNNDFRPASSPTRQIAMMLWATLWWYFHQPAPSPYLTNASSENTPEAARPKAEWRVNINREGIFKGKHLLPKLERMGLISSEDSCVGPDPDDGVHSTGENWAKMFVSRRSFWQMDARIYLFTLTPAQVNSPFPMISPAGSRPASPSRNSAAARSTEDASTGLPAMNIGRHVTPPGPFTSGSRLPTFYPPPPAQYTFTKSVRHPIRPKPPRQGETFYCRFVPSLGQYISFRVASLSDKPVAYRGPASVSLSELALGPGARDGLRSDYSSDGSVPTLNTLTMTEKVPHDTMYMNDAELLHKWMNDPRVAYSWGETGPIEHQEAFLKAGLTSKHSFPVIGCFDGKPFGYFELYWVKEDRLATHMGRDCEDYDRGLHVLVGEQEFRGPHRIKVWLSALVHYCWLADLRTNNVVLEPRVDNEK